jgi:NitT/TauT family transport system substrate-binding protein
MAAASAVIGLALLTVSACSSGNTSPNSKSTGGGLPPAAASGSAAGGGAPSNAASGAAQTSSAAAPATLTNVKVVTLAGSFVSLPISVANVEGFFKKNGINPSFVKMSAGLSASSALVSGSADMGLLASAEGLIAMSKGVNLQWIAGLTTSYAAQLVAATGVNLPNKAAGYPAVVKDLKGKKIGVTSIGSSSYYSLLSLLQGAGLTKSDVTIVGAGGNAAEVAGLKNHQLDAAVLTDPLTYQVNQQGIASTIVSFYEGSRPTIFNENMLNGIGATTEYIKAHPDVVQGVYKALEEADALMASFKSASDAIPLAKLLQPEFSGVSVDDLAKLIVQDRSVWTIKISKTGFDHAQQLTQQTGELPKLIDYATAVNPMAQG